MTLLGLSPGKAPDSEVTVGFRRGWPSSFKLVLSSAGGAAIAFAAVDLLDKQPKEGFALLGLWGPWPFIALISLAVVGSLLTGFNETIQKTLTQALQSSQTAAEAQGRTADALTKLAEQGGRQFEEVRRLAIFSAQESTGVYKRLDGQDEVMAETRDLVRELSRDLVHALIEKEKQGQEPHDR